MPWRFWLVELPARIVDVWPRVYWTILTMMCIGLFSTLVLSLALDWFGVRWGW